MSASVVLLAVAVVGLAIGPILARTWERGAAWREALDGLSLALVGGMSLFHLLPHAMEWAGGWAVLACAVGIVAPLLLQRIREDLARTWTAAALVLLLLHALFEGAALAVVTTGKVGLPLGVAVAAHRLPVGLAVYTAGAQSSRWGGWAGVGALMVATVVGFAAGGPLAHMGTELSHGIFEALVAGVLLHIVFEVPPARTRAARSPSHGFGHEHGHDHAAVPEAAACALPAAHDHSAHDHSAHDHAAHDHAAHDHSAHDHSAHDQPAPAALPVPGAHVHDSGPAGRWSAGGALLGLLAVGAVTLLAHDHSEDAHLDTHLETFLHLALESAPALLAGYVLAGLITALVPAGGTRWLQSPSRLGQSLRGVAFGLPLPVCSCGVLPLYESLVRRGIPAAAGVAFLVATPELGLDAVLLSVPLLGLPLTVARVVAAFVIALTVGILIAPSATSDAPPPPPPAAQRPLRTRLRAGLRYGLVELVDHTLPWVLLGLGIAAVAAPLLGHPALRALPPAVQVPLFALVGIPLYVCASGATPVAAVAVQQGVSAGAALALLIAGPATNVTTFGVLSALHSRGMALRFGLLVVGLAMVAGWAVDALDLAVPALDMTGAHHSEGPLAWLALALVGALTVASLFRQGPRGLLGQIVAPFR
jgi:hypothetical protein